MRFSYHFCRFVRDRKDFIQKIFNVCGSQAASRRLPKPPPAANIEKFCENDRKTFKLPKLRAIPTLFFLREARRKFFLRALWEQHGSPELSWRVGRGVGATWESRAELAGRKGWRRGEERRGGGTRLKSSNPNTEGGEKGRSQLEKKI